MKLAVLDAIVAGAAFALVACAPADAPETTETGCHLAVDFSPEARAAGQAALARINAATGCEVHEKEGSVPVMLVPVAEDLDGEPVCGATTIGWWKSTGALESIRSIEVSTEVEQCNSLEATLVHELIHAMLGTKSIHASSGVFHAVSGNGETLNEATLVTVCAHLPCPSFSPEP